MSLNPIIERHFRWSKLELYLVTGWIVFEFILFKGSFPHAITTYDSFFYIDAAEKNLKISYWPIGYSVFLRGLHYISHSDWLVMITQFLLLEGALLLLYATIIEFVQTSRWVRWVIMLATICNPLSIIISNYILSDALFSALTIVWFCLLIRLLIRPGFFIALIMAALITVLFSVRYYAEFYPLISIPVLLMAPKLSWRAKVATVFIGASMFFCFISFTSREYQKLTGRQEFSPFSGWWIAENALIMYKNIPSTSSDIFPGDLQSLHEYINAQLDSLRDTGNEIPVKLYYAVMDQDDVLNRYMNMKYRNDSSIAYFKKWASMGALYKEYGIFLIKRHPVYFFRYYILTGLGSFFFSNIEFTNVFENGSFYVPKKIMDYFGYENNQVDCSTTPFFSLMPYWYLLLISNILLPVAFVGFLILGHLQNVDRNTKIIFCFGAVYWLFNFLFSVIAAPPMLRYEIPFLFINLVWEIVILEKILRPSLVPLEVKRVSRG